MSFTLSTEYPKSNTLIPNACNTRDIDIEAKDQEQAPITLILTKHFLDPLLLDASPPTALHYTSPRTHLPQIIQTHPTAHAVCPPSIVSYHRPASPPFHQYNQGTLNSNSKAIYWLGAPLRH